MTLRISQLAQLVKFDRLTEPGLLESKRLYE